MATPTTPGRPSPVPPPSSHSPPSSIDDIVLPSSLSSLRKLSLSPVSDAPSSEFALKFRQQPRQARVCGEGEKGDRRPIDPPPIIQLNVVHRPLSEATSKLNVLDGDAGGATTKQKGKGKETEKSLQEEEAVAGQCYLQNPYYFMNATLTPASHSDEHLHLLKNGKTRYTSGQSVSSLFQLKDVDNTDAGFFVFPDLGVKVEGEFRLKLDLYEIVGHGLHYCTTIFSDSFRVYTATRYPGAETPSTLTRALSAQGVKVRLHGSSTPAPPPPPPSSRPRIVSSKRKPGVEGASRAPSRAEDPKRPKISDRSNAPASDGRKRKSLDEQTVQIDPHRRVSGSLLQQSRPSNPSFPPPPPHHVPERQPLGTRTGSYQEEGSRRQPPLVRRYTDEHSRLPPPPPHRPSSSHYPSHLSHAHGPLRTPLPVNAHHHYQHHLPPPHVSTPPPNPSEAARFYPSPHEPRHQPPPSPPPPHAQHLHLSRPSSSSHAGPSTSAWRREADDRAEREWRANEAARFASRHQAPPPQKVSSSFERDAHMPPPSITRSISEHGSRVTLPPLSSLPNRPTSSSSSVPPLLVPRRPSSPDRLPPPQSIIPLGRPGSSSSLTSSRPILSPPPISAAPPLLCSGSDAPSASPELSGLDAYRQSRGSGLSIRTSLSSDRHSSMSSDRYSLSSDRLSVSSMSSTPSIDHRFRNSANIGSEPRFSMNGGSYERQRGDARRPSETGPLGERKASLQSYDGGYTGGPSLSASRSSLPSLSEVMKERDDQPSVASSSAIPPPPFPQPRTSISPPSLHRMYDSPQRPTSSQRSSLTVMDHSRPTSPVGGEDPLATLYAANSTSAVPPLAWKPSQRMGIGNLLSSTDEEGLK